MYFYAYNSNVQLGSENLGSDGKVIWRDLKTTRSALARLRKLGWNQWSLYTFTNFYDSRTFCLVQIGKTESWPTERTSQ